MQISTKKIFPASNLVDDIPAEGKLTKVLDTSIQELVRSGCVRNDELAQFFSIRDQLLVWARHELMSDTESREPIAWCGWGWQPFENNLGIQSGLIHLYKSKPIPVHDHPGAVGILIVLQGELDIDEYQLDHIDNSTDMKLVKLFKRGQQSLGSLQYAFITPSKGNIHSLSTRSENCIVLDILLKPYDENDRTWYMPLNEEMSGSDVVMAFRVNKKTQLSKNSEKVNF